jgi:hypothetical protein
MGTWYWVSGALGLALLLSGALVARYAREPATAYTGTIGAGVGVLLLAIHALGSLSNGLG